MKLPRLIRRLVLPGAPPTVPFPDSPRFDRVTAFVYREFAEPQRVLAALKDLPEEQYGGQDRERIRAALVLAAQGTWDGFERALAVAGVDGRAARGAGGLASPECPQRRAAALGDGRRPA